ncbi:MAG: T9SS type A sorting domain-containing protein [Bacteroidota bacterium]
MLKFIIPLLPICLSAQMPGGVDSPILWLLAEEPNAQAVRTLARPIRGELQIFTVYSSQSPHEEAVWSLGENDTSAIVLTNRRLAELDDLNYISHELAVPGQQVFLHTYYRRKSDQDVKMHLYGYLLGQTHSYPSLPVSETSGELLELIIYDRVLTPQERQQVESYLAFKHGLTINQDKARHYLDASGQPFWDAEMGRPFGKRIAGIGRDIDLPIYRNEGRSQMPGGDLIQIGTDPLDCDYCFLTWSDDDATTALMNSTDNRLPTVERTWQVQSNRWPSQQALTIELDSRSMYSLPKNPEQWRLIVDPTGSGQFDPDHVQYFWPDEIDEETALVSWNKLKHVFPEEGLAHFSFGFDGPSFDSEGQFWRTALLSPNPSPDGRYQIRVEVEGSNPLIVNIYDNLGRLQKSIQSPSQQYHLINDHISQSGVYRLELIAGEQQKTLTLIIP